MHAPQLLVGALFLLVLFCVLQDSGGSRSGSDNEQSECSDEEEAGGSGRDTRSQRLAGRKHKSDTVLQKDESKKSGGTSGQGSGEGSGNGAAVCPDKPQPLVITPSQLQALQASGASLVFKPGKRIEQV